MHDRMHTVPRPSKCQNYERTTLEKVEHTDNRYVRGGNWGCGLSYTTVPPFCRDLVKAGSNSPAGDGTDTIANIQQKRVGRRRWTDRSRTPGCHGRITWTSR